MSNAYVNALDTRKAFELAKSADNTSMQTKLDALKKSVAHDRIAEILTASNVDAAFINRAERVNARFNVYAIEKVVNVARTLAAVASLNHFSRAILLTAQSLDNNDMTMTHADAQAACSLKIKSKDSKRDKFIVRYARHIEASTVTTQSSSSINALQMFDVLSETRDAANVVCYKLNKENETAKALLAALQA